MKYRNVFHKPIYRYNENGSNNNIMVWAIFYQIRSSTAFSNQYNLINAHPRLNIYTTWTSDKHHENFQSWSCAH